MNLLRFKFVGRILRAHALAALLCAHSLFGYTVVWNLDSTSGFDVTISGTGPTHASYDPLYGDRFVFGLVSGEMSPSGLWKVFGGANINYTPSGGSLGKILVKQGLPILAYLGTELPASYPESAGTPLLHPDFTWNIPLPIDSVFSGLVIRNPSNHTHPTGLGGFGWRLRFEQDLTVVNPSDSSSWTWTNRYVGSGPNLRVSVPDTCSTFAVLGISFLGLNLLRRRSIAGL
jgi:hypothetical protein